MFRLDAETAHEFGVKMMSLGLGGLVGAAKSVDDPRLRTSVFGLEFENPLGIAAGFDKNGIVVNQLASMGFGFVEVGTVTLKPQTGNPKPRMFRLPADKALINRLGFNNEGAVVVVDRLKMLRRKCVVGVNIGKNKDVPNEEATENYVQVFELIHSVADYITINISSPNTPNLRELQKPDSLDELLGALQKRNVEMGKKPLLVKIAPDLTTAEIESALNILLKHDIDGMIATNTTTDRNNLETVITENFRTGGLSGRPLAVRSNKVISAINRYSKGKLPIVGVGGVFTGQDAFDKIAAGASLIQAYTGFVYGGPTFACDVLRDLAIILHEHGFDSVQDAVGSAVY